MTLRAVLVAPVVAVAGLAVACSESAGPVAPTATALVSPSESARTRSAPAPTQAAQNFEVDFLTDMIDHHAMAVQTAGICVENAVHPELISLCQDIAAAQTSEIQTMQTWLQSWYGVSHEPEMNASGERMVEKLASLEGAEFEIAFMEMMIKHHAKAVEEGRKCLDKAWHAELRELCENIIATQSAEITQLRSWLCAWYGECK